MVQASRLTRPLWTMVAAACYPSTAGSGKYSLLCETSLTHCPPLYKPGDLCFRLNDVEDGLTENTTA
ncbi:hypothetical protein JHK85_043953 [Glycine max]|nr:hypothetical protein JHK85_043953 [Glycine max]